MCAGSRKGGAGIGANAWHAARGADPACADYGAREQCIETSWHDASNEFAKRSVYYPLDHYLVEPEFQPMLKTHAAYLSMHPGASILIEGYCDERGSREYNLALGQRRVDDVQKMMILLGASAKQIESVSFGEEQPRSSGHDESSWSQNRRSDIVYGREQ